MQPGQLLQWATSVSSHERQEPRREPFDPEMIEYILGKDDAVIMRDSMATACNTSLPIETRKISLEKFSDLVENIDNALNIQKMNLWGELIGLLDEDLAALAAHTMAVAVMNCEQALKDCLNANGLERVLSKFSQFNDSSTTAKCMYFISSAVKTDYSVWSVIKELDCVDLVVQALDSSDKSVKIKAAFLFTYLSECGEMLDDRIRQKVKEISDEEDLNLQ